ncbi:MAG: pyridoxamine 5'-phosphate oxidase [Erythrobacter sp.]
MTESEIPSGADPFELFQTWFDDAQASEPNDANAMALATAALNGAPSVRMVLLKGYGTSECSGGGFTFFTNAESRKGGEIRANMQAALLFHWKSLRRQIRIEGPLQEVTAKRADAYFHSRAFKSQVGSAASDQSRPLANRADYIERVEQLRTKHESDGVVPRPDHWTGFTMKPQTIEFWLDRDNRLHDRRMFTRTDPSDTWNNTLLFP